MEYEASLIEVIELTDVIKSFRFTIPDGFNFTAGQFAYLKPADKMMKCLSFSNSPTEKGYVEFTTKMSGSPYKNALGALKAGDKVRIQGPFGNFTYRPGLKRMSFLSGGIGITPIRSICKYLTDEKIDCDIILLYGNNSEREIAFKKDFDEMGRLNKRLKVVSVLANPSSNWAGHRGFITASLIEKEIPDFQERAFYICGPPGMVSAMSKTLEELKVGKEDIVLENFAGY